MGATLALRAYLVGRDLRPNTRHVLVRMALTAKDEDDPPRYFAGWEPLALALGRHVPSIGAQDSRRRHNLRAEVQGHWRTLRKAGLIDPSGVQARRGLNAEYLLRLIDPQPVLIALAEVRTNSPPSGSTESPPLGRAIRTQQGGQYALPKEKEEPLQELEQEPATSSPSATVPRPQAGDKQDRDGCRGRAQLVGDVGGRAYDVALAAARGELGPDAAERDVLKRATRLAAAGRDASFAEVVRATTGEAPGTCGVCGRLSFGGALHEACLSEAAP